jgi:hypothetical protein
MRGPRIWDEIWMLSPPPPPRGDVSSKSGDVSSKLHLGVNRPWHICRPVFMTTS